MFVFDWLSLIFVALILLGAIPNIFIQVDIYHILRENCTTNSITLHLIFLCLVWL
jgi:hypothetical protein